MGMDQIGCPYSKNAHSQQAGTGGPEPHSTYKILAGERAGETVEREDGTIEDELIAKIPNEEGTLSMASTGAPHSGGSQFFINTKNNDFLNYWDDSTPSKHPVFGKITEGYDIAKKIGEVPTYNNDDPIDPITVNSVSVDDATMEMWKKFF